MARWNGVDLAALRLEKKPPMTQQHQHQQQQTSFKPGDVSALFEGELRKTSLSMATVWMASGFSFYGIMLLLTRVSASISTGDCTFNYPFLFTTYCTQLIGIVVLVLTIDTWGRVGSQAVHYILAGVATVVLGSTFHPNVAMISGSVAVAAMTAATTATWIATPELFPTQLRSSAHSLASAAARIGASFSGYVVDSELSPQTVGIVIAALNAVASAAVTNTRETKRAHLQ
jgi:putative MFS transporter